ncbi:MAG: YkgJ family cysteine cluster protein [Myxococcales bacterium]|nr:YkgJ family cysteine cluster protein [Myxococcales bacterium]
MIDPGGVYFTWPDRGLSYACAGCGACCKGLGIGLDVAGGQLTALAARRPEIVPFLRRRGDATTLWNPRDRCWFLEGDGLCRIEVEDGRAAKPASCRLFPFNRVFTLGAITVVDYNSVICPLRVGGAAPVAHADILAELATIVDPAIVGVTLPADVDGAAILAGERALADQVFAIAAAPGDDWEARLVAALGADGDAAASVRGLLAALGMAAPRPLPPATRAAALTLIPSLRFNELWGPRQYAPRAVMRGKLAGMTLAWLELAGVGAAIAGRELGMQELTTLWSEQAAVMYAAARWGDVPRLRPGPLELPSSDPGGLVRALGQACVDNRKAGRTLAAIAGPILAAASAIERVTALKLAEPVLRAAFASARA